MLDTVIALHQAARNNVINLRWIKVIVASSAMSEQMCWRKKGLKTPFEKQHKFQNYHPASSSPSIVRDLNTVGMNTGIPARTVVILSNGSLPFAKRLLLNFFGRAGRNLVKRYS